MGLANILTGKSGESISLGYLRKAGYKILYTNFITPYGEIDIVCLDRGTLVFIEVKTRATDEFGPPQLSITPYKKRTIIKNALYFLTKNWKKDTPVRLDVIAITLDEYNYLTKLEHLESAIWVNEK